MPRKQGHTAKGACDRAVDEMGYEGLVPVGDVGTGKTHMAEALCALACQRARPARLLAASSLAMRLRRARDDGRPDRELAQPGGAELLVIDELGFLPLDADGARLLSRVVPEAYETQSVAFTTNLEFSRWGESHPLSFTGGNHAASGRAACASSYSQGLM